MDHPKKFTLAPQFHTFFAIVYELQKNLQSSLQNKVIEFVSLGLIMNVLFSKLDTLISKYGFKSKSNDTFESVILERVKIESVRVDRHPHGYL